MQKGKAHPAVIIGAIALIILSLVLIFRQVTTPSETIADPSKVLPKGAARGADKE